MNVDSTTVVQRYLDAAAEISSKVSTEAVNQAVDIIYEAWRQDRTVYTIGNGGSASTASHFASDLAKFAMVDGKKRLKAVSLVDNIPLVSAWTNDSGFQSIFAEQLDPWLQKGDVLVAISVHGGSGEGEAGPWSQNLLRAVMLAHERGAKVVGLSGFGGGALSKMADVCLVVPIDEEPLATPLVESFHVALHHLVCLALKLRIAES